jgi:hypothetical protein
VLVGIREARGRKSEVEDRQIARVKHKVRAKRTGSTERGVRSKEFEKQGAGR